MGSVLGIFMNHPPETLAIILNILLEVGTIYFWRRIPFRYRLLCVAIGLAGLYIGVSELLRLETLLNP